MKLNHDTIRTILLILEDKLTVEKYEEDEYSFEFNTVFLPNLRGDERLNEISNEEIAYTVIKMGEAGLIETNYQIWR